VLVDAHHPAQGSATKKAPPIAKKKIKASISDGQLIQKTAPPIVLRFIAPKQSVIDPVCGLSVAADTSFARVFRQHLCLYSATCQGDKTMSFFCSAA
jgi:hypothetical protein